VNVVRNSERLRSPVTAAAVIPAAGLGVRLGPGIPKALRLLRGEPMLVHAARAVAAAPSIRQIVVAAPPTEVDAVRVLLLDLLLDPFGVDVSGSVAILVVDGGRDRTESVGRALAAVDASADVVLVHDAARPLAPTDLFERVVSAVVAGADAVVPVLPVTDTIKLVGPGGRLAGTLDRDGLGAAQTPQGFRREVLVRAHEQLAAAGGAVPATDDAALVERLGIDVHTVEGSPEAFKVTRPIDVLLAEAVLERRAAVGLR
jgi:2-C-methyl-D-erythritol 4-phosphate cytidylyltransferase